MYKPKDPRELAVAMISRSTCAVQVGACIGDRTGVFAWGCNHVGFDGLGCHAELECLRRANRGRLAGATMWVAARRRRNGRTVTGKPCAACKSFLHGCRVKEVIYRDREGWKSL
jgi:tRNA(Arg) A34 adenosine deaminase TadA